MSNHDEVQDAINDNHVDLPNTELFTPGGGFPHSKRSGKTSKWNYIDDNQRIETQN